MKPEDVVVNLGLHTHAQLLGTKTSASAGTLLGYTVHSEAVDGVRFVVTGLRFDDSSGEPEVAQFPLGIHAIGRFIITKESQVQVQHQQQMHSFMNLSNSLKSQDTDSSCGSLTVVSFSNAIERNAQNPTDWFAWHPDTASESLPQPPAQVSLVSEQQVVQADMILVQVRVDTSVAYWAPTNEPLNDIGHAGVVAERIVSRMLERVHGTRGRAETPFAELPCGAVVPLNGATENVDHMDAESMLLQSRSDHESGNKGTTTNVKMFIPKHNSGSSSRASGSGKGKSSKGKGGKGFTRKSGGGNRNNQNNNTNNNKTNIVRSSDAPDVLHFLHSGDHAESAGLACADVRLLWLVPVTDPALSPSPVSAMQTAKESNDISVSYAPVVSLTPINLNPTASTDTNVELAEYVLRLSTLCMLPRSASATNTVSLLQAAVICALVDLKQSYEVTDPTQTAAAQVVHSNATTLHFWPSTFGLPVSVTVQHDASTLRQGLRGAEGVEDVDPTVFESQFWIDVGNSTDEVMSFANREHMHRQLFGVSLPPVAPTFQPCCAVVPVSRPTSATGSTDLCLGTEMNTPLRNVHTGPYALSPTTVSNPRVGLVHGDYAYYHYKMENMDDGGWGCAYRSLQSIISWFRLNRHIDANVPSLNDIQQILVDMKVMDAAFKVGCQQWIGSFEVEWVLGKLVAGVQCKRMTLTCGSEMQDKARELLVHFETHGTPVMIGGGSLAFTLVGVAFNQESGQVEYLILDPHYTGANILRTVQSKKQTLEGYKAIPCGWRTVADAFVKGKPYNICLPQNPAGPIDL